MTCLLAGKRGPPKLCWLSCKLLRGKPTLSAPDTKNHTVSVHLYPSFRGPHDTSTRQQRPWANSERKPRSPKDAFTTDSDLHHRGRGRAHQHNRRGDHQQPGKTGSTTLPTVLCDHFCDNQDSRLTHAVGVKQLWRIFNALPTKLSAQFAEQRKLQQDYLKVRRELNATSSQDEFAKWAKLRRQHDKLLEQLEKKSKHRTAHVL